MTGFGDQLEKIQINATKIQTKNKQNMFLN